MTIATLKSILIGVGGSMILAVFCSTFIAMDKILFILPVFIAFNGAMTGYRMVEVMKTRIKNLPLFSFVLGIGGGALTFVAVNFALSYAMQSTWSLMGNTVLLNITDLFIYMTVSGITSYLGAKLAIRYFNL